jgi:hypothetical protein
MPSKPSLMMRSARRAGPRLELGARLEARTAAMQNFLTSTATNSAHIRYGIARMVNGL